MKYEKEIDYQDVANFNKRNIYIYKMEDGTKVASFFEYKIGEAYGKKLLKVSKLLKTYEVKK